ncbi:hypothetical protein N2152v2_006826 [Parachlorella kessleri]
MCARGLLLEAEYLSTGGEGRSPEAPWFGWCFPMIAVNVTVDVLCLCNAFNESDALLVMAKVSAANHSLVVIFLVTAVAGCAPEAAECPLLAVLLDSPETPACWVYSTGIQAGGPAPSERIAKDEVLAPRPGGDSTTDTGNESQIATIIKYVGGGLLILIIKVGIIAWLVKRGSKPVVEGAVVNVQMDVQLC